MLVGPNQRHQGLQKDSPLIDIHSLACVDRPAPQQTLSYVLCKQGGTKPVHMQQATIRTVPPPTHGTWGLRLGSAHAAGHPAQCDSHAGLLRVRDKGTARRAHRVSDARTKMLLGRLAQGA